MSPKKFVLGWLGLLLLMALTACEAEVPTPPPLITPTTPPTTLRIGLSGNASEIETLTAVPFTEQYPHIPLQFIPANDNTLLDDLADGQLDAALIHYLPATSQNWFNPVALDGLVVIVHPDNPVSDLSTAEIQAIFNGRIANWSSLGGPDLPIELVSREQGAGSRTIFSERIMLEQRVSVTAEVVTDNEQMVSAVAANPAAIGYSMMGTIDDGVKAVAIEGVMAKVSTTADQSYPLTAPLYFVSPNEPTAELRAFLGWLQSEEGQTIVGEKYGRVR